jgi:ketosteroid isomerase-like protein
VWVLNAGSRAKAGVSWPYSVVKTFLFKNLGCPYKAATGLARHLLQLKGRNVITHREAVLPVIALFRRTLLILLVLLAVLSVDALAQTGSGSVLPTGTVKKTSGKVSGKKTVRKKVRRRMMRNGGRKAVRKATFGSQPVARIRSGKTPTGVAVATPKVTTALAAAHLTGEAPTATTEQVQYDLAGYVATADGTPARMWRSREYTVHSPYAYLGRMKFGETWEHVWVETTGNLLASAVTEASAEPMPDIARMMERFPDGGLGVVVAGWDDFAPPAEPSVEVVEFGDHQPGVTR